MEPITFLVELTQDGAIFTGGSQFQTLDQGVAAHILGTTPDKITIETTWAGGSFGRRAIYDSHYAAEAATIAKLWRDQTGQMRPIKLVYTRKDDIQGGYYRPMFTYKVSAGLDEEGRLIALHSRSAGQSILIGSPFEQFLVKDGIDATSVEGLLDSTYAVPNFRVEIHNAKSPVPVLWWRSVGHTHTGYVMETIIDEAARRAGQDPVAYRLAMLPDGDRRRDVLEQVAKNSGWGAPLPAGHFRGVAVNKSFESYVAEVAEVARDDQGRFRVVKVWAAVDCGAVVNPDIVKAQIEGGIGYGLGAVLRNAVTLGEGGAIEQANFDTYQPLRLSDMPEIHVTLLDSEHEPTGVGEPGVPPIGPAVANAIAAATGSVPTIPPLAQAGLV